jgi:hypothetical protein
MIGGLLKSTASRLALFAAAGVLAGGMAVPSAKAADLGGDCCADLEERVAELEATTARKGNRKMNLTVSGQIDRAIMYWNDGTKSDVYAGVDNHVQSSRFIFSGDAKIYPTLKAGFEFMVEWAPLARSSGVSQFSVDGAAFSATAASAQGDGLLAVRTANWWLEDKTLGRVTVGRINVAGPVATIDLGGISTVATSAPSLIGGGFLANPNYATHTGNVTLSRLEAPVYGGDRMEGIRYDSQSLGGFLLQADWGEDNVYSASIRYAGEFSGFQVAAGIGFLHQDLDFDQQVLPAGANFGGMDTGGDPFLRGKTEWSGSLAFKHVASGLFAQGHYAKSEFFNGNDAHMWMVQGGISKNWFGVGNTSLYGEWGDMDNYAAAGINAGVTATSDVKFVGAGVVQQIDAAAMELYLGWRRFDVNAAGTLDASAPFGAAATSLLPITGTAATAAGPVIDHIDIVTGGARIRF